MKRLILSCACAAALPAAAYANSPWLSRVVEYSPAPGQFVNMIPRFEEGDDAEKMAEKASEYICGADYHELSMISLGAFGGHVIVKFDHPVVNVEGEYDFKIFGNAFVDALNAGGGSSEPGIVSVSMDENGNGLPDDPWYELAGSDYALESTRKQYTITYYRPDPDRAVNADPDPDSPYISDRTYIRWTSDSGEEGYVMRNTSHRQSYWPLWLDGETFEFTGTKLADNFSLSDDGTYYTLSFLDYGYVDNLPNEAEVGDRGVDPGFKLDWAVNKNGKPVKINQVDFIRIHTAVNQYCGWLGESSTEICGGEDLHPDAVASSTEPPVDPDLTGIATAEACHLVLMSASGRRAVVRADAETAYALYDLNGRLLREGRLSAGSNTLDLSALPQAVYLLRTPAATLKVAL